MNVIDVIEIVRLVRETREGDSIEKILREGGSLYDIKKELRKYLIEWPLEKLQTLSDLSQIKENLKILNQKLYPKETSKIVECYLEAPKYIQKGKYYWWEYVDQLLILADIGDFTQETADKILMKCFDEKVPTTPQLLELLKKLMPLASENVREKVNNWYFRGITEKEIPEKWSDKKIKVVEIDRNTMITKENEVYNKIVFKKSCVISGSLSAKEIEAEGNLIVYGDLEVEKRAKIKGNLVVFGKLKGGRYYPEKWHGPYRSSAEYTGYFEIKGNLIAGKIDSYARIIAEGDIISGSVSVAEVIEAKNIFTPGTLSLFSEEGNTVRVKEKIVADSILANAWNRGSYIEAKIIECVNTLQAEEIKANKLIASNISK